ncbi:hypothetical protein EYM_01750 [Ignicoccus islandicus DSM 13165]|uniref:Uncharacterized protein n=1 Tax=Ignicoccus islandicus DSM 13165 TaxID=940295 RepID=A0A0U2WMR1_9CREN|nr:ATP-binding protein [Ignicoccus islandicus]ALU12241.1 hypothetical protein EYM_01750 [Ignicoccus islandicus DSM 13165]
MANNERFKKSFTPWIPDKDTFKCLENTREELRELIQAIRDFYDDSREYFNEYIGTGESETERLINNYKKLCRYIESRSNAIFVHGPPGSGKSTIMGHALWYLSINEDSRFSEHPINVPLYLLGILDISLLPPNDTLMQWLFTLLEENTRELIERYNKLGYTREEDIENMKELKRHLNSLKKYFPFFETGIVDLAKFFSTDIEELEEVVQ